MPDSSAIPVRRAEDARQAKAAADGAAKAKLPAINPAGPRKLIRPHLPAGTPANRYPTRVAPIYSLPATRKTRTSDGDSGESSHAETFYFQKQIQAQTMMVFVMDDGEQIEGQIEWYDRNAIKVRNGKVRTLIYKSSIKYLYKRAEKPPK
jgi:sRNA-binding regulator protein Hfq